jgi:hypothetical protein
MSGSDRIVDFDLSEDQVTDALRYFKVQNHEMSSLMIRVMRLVTTREFYENKEEISAIPDYGFRPHDLVGALDMAENSRETVRKSVIKRLESKGVLDRTEPAPNSPHTHYYLSQEFREYLENTDLDEVISEPDEAEDEQRIVDLPYHDEELNRAPGDHTQLIANGLSNLVPRLADNPVLVQEGLDKTEREDVQNMRMPIEFAGLTFELPVYPDAIVYDESDETLYMLEAVTSLGPFTNQRIERVLGALKQGQSALGRSDGPTSFDVVFVTMFPDERRYRNFLMDLGDRSYVWLSDHKNELRSHGKKPIENEGTRASLDFRHHIAF